MRCHFFPGGVVCTSRRSLPNCSTPGCRNKADKSCDHPVKRTKAPKAGDTRVHRTHRIVFYIHAIEGERVTLGTQPLALPGQRHGGAVQTVTLAELAERSDPTCDRPMCGLCAVQHGQLEYCGVHGREHQAQQSLPIPGAR